MKRPLNLLLRVFALTTLFPAAEAAVVNWGSPTTIAGDSDVSTSGTLVGAANLIIPGAETALTINGVTFSHWDPSSSFHLTSGAFSLPSAIPAYSASTNASPFGNLSPAYRDVLRDGGFTNGGTTLTISGLTVGQTYAFQWWSTTPAELSFSNSPNLPTTATAGNSVTLDPNITDSTGGLGQFSIGSFTADAATQTVGFSAGAITAMQLRQTSQATGVADGGSSIALLGVTVMGLIAMRRRLH